MTSDTPSQAARVEAGVSLGAQLNQAALSIRRMRETVADVVEMLNRHGGACTQNAIEQLTFALNAAPASPPAEALPSQTSGAEAMGPEDEAEHFIQAAIDSAPEPLRRLGEWLANKLDDDDWKTADRLITGAAVSCAAMSAELDQAAGVIEDRNAALAKPASESAGGGVTVNRKLLLEWADDFDEASKKFERFEKCVLRTRAQECRDHAALSSPASSSPAEACEYCSNGKYTGPPGNACENCLGTGLKYPEASK